MPLTATSDLTEPCQARTKPRRQRSAVFSLCASALALGLVSIGTPALAQLVPAPSPQVTEYALPNLAAGPCEVEFDRNGFVWIEEVVANAIGRFDPRSRTFVNFPLAQPLSVPGGMEVGPDGALWFPQVGANVITRLDTSDGSMQSFPIPAGLIASGTYNAGTALGSDITTGKDGAMWFSMSGISAVGRIDIYTKQIEIIPLPKPLSTPVLVTQTLALTRFDPPSLNRTDPVTGEILVTDEVVVRGLKLPLGASRLTACRAFILGGGPGDRAGEAHVAALLETAAFGLARAGL